MRAITAGVLLELWERADGLPPVERALTLAERAGGDRAELRDAPYGQTNEHVLSLREELFGTTLEGTATCPTCGTRAEFSVDTIGLRGHARPTGTTVTAGGYAVRWRCPTPSDLEEAVGGADPAAALWSRCVQATAAGEPVELSELPADVLSSVEATIEDADPLAEVLVGLTCPGCGAWFDSDLDVAAFVWAEVEARAIHVLHEIDVLARCYGWREPDVLALTEARRGAYLRIALDGGA